MLLVVNPTVKFAFNFTPIGQFLLTGASIYDVRSGWGEVGPQKADEADVIYGSPLNGSIPL